VHHVILWWHSRKERVLLVFAAQCFTYSAFCLAITAYFQATTIPDIQATLDRFVTIGVLSHVGAFLFYDLLGVRRGRALRVIIIGLLVALAILNQWSPLRGTVTALQTVQLPGGVTSIVPIRTPPGVGLAVLYLTVLVTHGYGLRIAHAVWKRDRAGAVLLAFGALVILCGAGLGLLVDYAHVRAPYGGAWPHAFFLFCATLFLSREYSARGARLLASETELRAHRERLEELVATRTLELNQAKDEAERANRAKSQFLAHISHEIRNPLHAMLAYAQSLERDGSLGEAQRTKIGVVRSSGKHLQALISDVLDMSKIEASRPELVEAPFDPWVTLAEVEQMFAAEAEAKGVELTIRHAPDLARPLLGDGAKVKQILINLVSNAVKFTDRGSVQLEASSRPVEDGLILARVVVADTGIGIAAQDRSRMFQPFEQLDAGRRAGGTGLGLAISFAYARSMGGDLSVESTPGAGSAFTLTYVAKLGSALAAPEPQTAPARVVHGEARRKVLIVDDVALNRSILAELLRENGFETNTAEDGQSAISVHADWQPDIVLIDLRMPGMGGLEAIQRMRAAGSAAAIGALSASTFEEDVREALACGADFFVRKPYEYGELLDQLARVGAATPGDDPQAAVSRAPSSAQPDYEQAGKE
jgi:signal transduction histidine kinase/CheY-like chemotaxis protein